MNQLEEFREGLQYSDEVKNAVRYGYQYRKEAEKLESSFVHHCLPDPSQILLWLGQCIIGGVVWDEIKQLAKNAYTEFVNSKKPLSAELNSILKEERELQTFYKYVKEFNEHSMSVTDNQFKYIREEIVADYYRKECGRIFENEKRLPTTQEYIRINREANEYADRIMRYRE